jgi:hypothetical protein
MRLRFLLLTLIFLIVSSFAPPQVATPRRIAQPQMLEQALPNHQTDDIITLERFFCYEPRYFRELIIAYQFRFQRPEVSEYISARILNECFSREIEMRPDRIIYSTLIYGTNIAIWRAHGLVDRDQGTVRTVFFISFSKYSRNT